MELTAHRRCDAQMRELAQLGIPYAQRSDGSLVVLRAVVETVLGGVPTWTKPEPEVVPEPELVLERRAARRRRTSAGR